MKHHAPKPPLPVDVHPLLPAPADQPPTADAPLGPTPSFAPITESEALALPLAPEQRTALAHLTAGATIIAAANAAGVSRITLWRWLRTNPTFQAAYNAWQRDLIATNRAKLLALAGSAIAALEKSMSSGDGKLALKLLKSLGLATPPTPGPTEPDDVQRAEELAQRQRDHEARTAEVKLAKAESELSLDALLADAYPRPPKP